MITSAAFVNLSAAYDTVNHRILIQKLYNITQDSPLCRVIQNMLSSWRFYVELNHERSRWRKQKNSLPQGNVLSPILINIYTNDQPLHNGTRIFIYADDLCVTAQQLSFVEVETTIEESLSELTQYYRSNNLCANPDKTQVTAFHLRNKEAKRTLKVKWNSTDLENPPPHHKYLTRRWRLRHATTSLESCPALKWGTNASTIRTTALALSYSVAEYASPVWARSAHAYKLDSELNSACRAIAGCIKPTNVEELYLLSAPPSIRRDVCARVEKAKQETNDAHSLHGKSQQRDAWNLETLKS